MLRHWFEHKLRTQPSTIRTWPAKYHRELQFSGQLQNQSRHSPESLGPSIHLLEVADIFEIVKGEQVS
jgi:hypothetical protein